MDYIWLHTAQLHIDDIIREKREYGKVRENNV